MASLNYVWLFLIVIVVVLAIPFFEGNDQLTQASILQKVFCKVAVDNIVTGIAVCQNQNDTIHLVQGPGILMNITSNQINITSIGGVDNQGTNVGGGAQVYKFNTPPNLVFRTFIGSGGITVTQNTNDLTFTGTNTAQISNADNAGKGLFGSRTNATSNTIKSLTSGTGISLGSNSTDVSITNTGVTSALGTANNVTVSSSIGTVTFNLGSNVVTTGGQSQIITKGLTINSGTLGGNLNVGSNAFTNAGHLITLPLNTGIVCLTNQSGSCGTGGTDTNTAQIFNADHAGVGLFGSRLNATANTIKSLTAGTGISLGGNSTDVSITNTGVTSISINGNSRTSFINVANTTQANTFTQTNTFTGSLVGGNLQSANSWRVYINGSNTSIKDQANKILYTGAVRTAMSIPINSSSVGTIYLENGTYDLDSSFAGFTFPEASSQLCVIFDSGATLRVPNGYTGFVFKFQRGSHHECVVGNSEGKITERGSPPLLSWTTFIIQAGVGTKNNGTGGTFDITISHMNVQNAHVFLLFNGTNDVAGKPEYANDNIISSNYVGNFVRCVDFNFTQDAPVANAGQGFNHNSFTDNTFQSGGSSNGSCFNGIKHDRNYFSNDQIWDVTAGEHSFTTSVNATGTQFMGGSLDKTQNHPVDNEADTIYCTEQNPCGGLGGFVTLSGIQTITGQKTFTGNPIFDGAGSVAPLTIGTHGSDPTLQSKGATWINGQLLRFRDNSNNTQTVDTLGNAQTFTAKKSFTETASQASININTRAASPTLYTKGDMWINGSGLAFVDNSNTTQLVVTGTGFVTLTGQQTISGQKTFSGDPIFDGSGAVAPLRIGTAGSNPTLLTKGDTWINGLLFRYRDNSNNTQTMATLGNTQTFTVKNTFTTTSTTAPINLGNRSSDITSPRAGDLRIIGSNLIYNDNTNTTRILSVSTPSSSGLTAATSPSTFIVFVNGTNYQVNNATSGLQIHSSNNATAEIQYAINNLPSGKGKVLIKNGNYPLTAPITIGSQLMILDGDMPTLQANAAVVSPMIKMVDSSQRSGIQIRNLILQNTGASGSGTGLDMSHFAASKAENIWLTGNFHTGIMINSTDAFYNTIENVRVGITGLNSTGIYIGNGANDNTVIRTRILTDGNATGIYINAHANNLISNDVESGAKYGLDVGPLGNDLDVTNIYLELNKVNVRLQAGVVGTVFNGGTIIDATVANIVDNGANRPVYSGTTIQYAATFDLGGNNILRTGPVQFNTSTTQPSGSTIYIRGSSNIPNRMEFNVPSGSEYDYLVNHVIAAAYSASRMNIEKHDLVGVLDLQSAANTIASTGVIRLGNMENLTWASNPAGSSVSFRVDTNNNFVFGKNATSIDANTHKIINLSNATLKNDAVNARMLGLLGNMTFGSKCSDNQVLAYQASNQTWICSSVTSDIDNFLISLNGDTTGAQTISGTANNVTVTNAGATHTLNLGSNAVVTNGVNQTIAKALTFTSGNKLSLSPSNTWASINIGSGTADPTSPRKADIWINTNTMKYNDNNNNTDSIMALSLTQTVTGAKTFTGADKVTTGSFDFSGTANSLKILSGGLTIRNPAGTFGYAITGGAITSNVTSLALPIPAGATDTFAVLGTAQTFTAKNTFTPTATTSSFNLGTLTSDLTSPRQGDLRIVGANIKIQDNSNRTETLLNTNSSGSSLTGIVTSITGTANNVTASSSNGAVTLNLGSNVVTTNGKNQTITKWINFTSGTVLQLLNVSTSSTPLRASLNIGCPVNQPSTVTFGDIWCVNGGILRYRASGTTFQISAVSSAETFSGAKTFTGANVDTTGSFSFSNTANSLRVLSNGLTIRNPAGTFGYDVVSSAITANRTLTLPLTTQTETLQVEFNTNSSNGGNNTGITTGIFVGNPTMITTKDQGKIFIDFGKNGWVSPSTLSSGCTVTLYYSLASSGTIPTNGSSTILGTKAFPVQQLDSAVAGDEISVNAGGWVSGLSTYSKYWVSPWVSNQNGATGSCSILRPTTSLTGY